MAKFKANRKTYRIVFPEGHELHGLEMVCRGVPLGDITTLARLERAIRSSGYTSPEGIQALALIQDKFGDALVSWNLTDDDDVDVPPTREGLDEIDPPQLMEAILAWAQRLTAVDNPLQRPSIPTAGIPMNPSLATLPMTDVPLS